MKPEKYHLYDKVDWAAVYTRLHLVASRCADGMADVFDGVSPEDIVSQVLTTFFESPDGLGWNPPNGPLDRFLMGVLRHKIVDRIRRQRRIAGSVDDPEFAKKIYLVQPTKGFEESTELCEQIHEAARGDKKLEELVSAVSDVEGGHNINQQLAEELHTSPGDVVNRKKRLVRRYRRNTDPLP
jgi:DNA-directed RNA polymerase specialized sigma24 family protein